MNMKKVSATATAVVMLGANLTGAAFADEEQNVIFQKDFSTAAAINNMTAADGDDPGWTVEGYVEDYYGNLRIGHQWKTYPSYIAKDYDTIGANYEFTMQMKILSSGDGSGYIPAEALADGTYYTARTTIKNGTYALDFSIENDGIYGVNDSYEWTKLYSGENYADGAQHIYKVAVSGDSAEFYRDDAKLFTYDLPADVGTAGYKFGVNGSQTYPASAYVNNIKLISSGESTQTKNELISITAGTADELAAIKADTSYSFVNPHAIEKTEWETSYEFNCGKTQGDDGNYGNGTISMKKDISGISSKYLYRAEYRRGTNGSTKTLADGARTGRCVVSGEYLLDFTTEIDGIYAKTADSAYEYVKVADTGLPVNTKAVFTAYVDKDTAIISQNGIKLCKYKLPVSLEENNWKYEVKASHTQVFSIALYDLLGDADSKIKTMEIAPKTEQDFNAILADSSVTVEPEGNALYWNIYKSAYNMEFNSGRSSLDAGENNWGKGRVSFIKNIDTIGSRYIYYADINRGETELTEKTEGTTSARNVVANGKYLLDFTCEPDGIYAKTADSPTAYVKISDTAFASQETALFTVFVEDDSAVIAKNGELAASYKLAATEDTGYRFEVKASVANVQSLSVYNYPKPKARPTANIADGVLTLTSGDFDETVNSYCPYYIIAAVYNKTTKALTDINFAEITPLSGVQTVKVDYNPSEQYVLIYKWQSVSSMVPCVAEQTLEEFIG